MIKIKRLSDYDLIFLIIWMIPFLYMFMILWINTGSLEYETVTSIIGLLCTTVFVYYIFRPEIKKKKGG